MLSSALVVKEHARTSNVNLNLPSRRHGTRCSPLPSVLFPLPPATAPLDAIWFEDDAPRSIAPFSISDAVGSHERYREMYC